MKRKFGCLFAFVCFVAILLFVGWHLTQAPQIGDDFARLPAVTKAKRRASVKQLTEQLQSVVTAGRRGDHKPFTVVITEDELNTLFQDNLKSDKFAVRDLRAALTPGEIALQGRVVLKGFEAVITGRGTVELHNGAMRSTVHSLQIGGLPAPSAWKEKMAKPITKVLNDQLGNALGKISRLEIGEKTLTIEGITH